MNAILPKKIDHLTSPLSDERWEAYEYFEDYEPHSISDVRQIIVALGEISSPLDGVKNKAVWTLARSLAHAPALVREHVQETVPDSISRLLAMDSLLTAPRCELIQILGLIESRESIANWVSHFLTEGPYVPRKLVPTSFFHSPPHMGVLFPKLTEGLTSPSRRSVVVRIATAALRSNRGASHPLEDHLDILAEMLVGDPGDRKAALDAVTYVTDTSIERHLIRLLESNDPTESLHAAHALAARGSPNGIRYLKDAHKDPLTHYLAAKSLKELGLLNRTRRLELTADDDAVAQLAYWLEDSRELGRIPEKVYILDKRVLKWPPSRKNIFFYALRFEGRDLVGNQVSAVGVVGGTTFSFFDPEFISYPVEDIYAYHCVWELESTGLIVLEQVGSNYGEYASLMKLWKGGDLTSVRVLEVAELSPKLSYGGSCVLLVSAARNGESGYAICDGRRSKWIPALSDGRVPDPAQALRVHIGRTLLGFSRSHTYETTRHKARSVNNESPVRTVTEHARIKEWDTHVASLGKLSPSQCAEVLNPSGPKGYDYFQEYVSGLVRLGRGSEVKGAIEFLCVYWDSVAGRAELGMAAYKCGLHKSAQRFLEDVVQLYPESYSGEWPDALASSLLETGRANEAKQVLIDAMKRTVSHYRTSAEDSKNHLHRLFSSRRKNYLSHFGAHALEDLSREEIPNSLE